MSVSGPTIQRTTEGGVCVLTFDRPESGANIFDAATLRDLDQQLDAIERDVSIKSLIITSAKKSIFVAGADLKTLLCQAQTGELRAFIADGQRIFNRLAALKIPTGAAIHGACAGGGYEITLCCDYRIASNEPATKIGLPETTLGLVPAWGGCTRLPRLIGAEKAAEAITKGKLYSATEAKLLGLVDEIATRETLLEATKNKLRAGKRSAPDYLPEREAAKQSATAEGVSKRVVGNQAPARALEIINRKLPVHESLAAELDAIVALGETEATQNLIRNFFLAEKYKKGTSKAPPEKILHAAVIGAGVMGSGIAQWLSARGVTVILRDVTRDFIDRGLASIDKTYADAVKRGIMSEAKAKEGRARIICSTAHVEMRDVQVVIEAASEKMEIKQDIFRELKKVAPNAVLATNTSALSISELGRASGEPERVIGLHFFNPVSRMKLIEVVVGEKTWEKTREAALAFARQIGKLPVLVRDRPGFLVNRVLFPYLLDAAEMFEQGADGKTMDDAMVAWGMPMGPLRLIDEIGVDITVDIAATLEKAFGARDHAPAVLTWLRENAMLGRKTGSGFYKYEGKSQAPNERVEQWRRALHGNPEGTNSKNALPTSAEEVQQRLASLMVNEAARCLEEGVVVSPEDADYGMILGTGFAPWRGGPLRFADHFGIKNIVEVMDELHARAGAGDKFVPCNLLREHAKKGTKFYEDTPRSAA